MKLKWFGLGYRVIGYAKNKELGWYQHFTSSYTWNKKSEAVEVAHAWQKKNRTQQWIVKLSRRTGYDYN